MDMRTEFKKREHELNDVLKDCDTFLKKAPSGNLKVDTRNGNTRYYLRTPEGDNSTKYIRKSNLDKARRIAQRDYELAVKTAITKEISAIKSYTSKMPQLTYEHAYDNICSGRKVLITPHFIPDDQFISAWYNEPYESLEFNSDTPLHLTDCGIRVRSKSEVMIGNALTKAGVVFKYECPLFLGSKKIYPDFTILKMPSRKEIYWEHLGLLDDSEYVNRNMEKLDYYEENGIFLGDGLIITRETSSHPLNMKQVWTMIDHYLL